MSSRFPVSPPMSEDKEGIYDLHRFAQHNATTQQQDQWSLDGADLLPSGSSTSFSSPQQGYRLLDNFGRLYPSSHPTAMDPATGYTSDIHGNVRYPPYQSGGYYLTPPPQEMYGEGYSPAAISTPTHSDRSEGRKGVKRSHRRNQSTTDDGYPSSTGAKATKSVKKSKGKKENKSNLAAPVSVLTKDLTVPIKDMETHAKRSVEERRRLVVKAGGKIPRPMNAFMLYRSAYADRIKAWCAHNNHQLVSSVAGDSWHLESEEIRDFYQQLSVVEREMHAKAHPDYKFSPAKTPNFGRKRKGIDSDEEDVLSELGPADSEWKPTSGRRTNRAKKSRNETHPDSWMMTHGQQLGYSNPAVSYTFPTGQALPHEDPYRQYHQSVVHPDPQMLNMENSFAQVPGDQLELSQELLGLPRMEPYVMTEDQTDTFWEDSASLAAETQLDPRLVSFEQNLEGHATQGPASAGLHGLDEVRAFNTSIKEMDD